MNRLPLTPSDLLRIRLPGDPSCAPDGRIFFVLASQNEAEDRAESAIYSIRPGSEPVLFTSGRNDRKPRVSPDGSALAFIADRGAGKRIFVVPLGGGEGGPITPAYNEIAALEWSPDSTSLAFVATAEHDPQTAKIALDERTGARHIRALPFKSDDDGLLDGRRRHLYTIAAAGGEPHRETSGDFDVADPGWSPDGSQIAFVAAIATPETSFYADVHTVTLAGGSLRKLTRSLGPCAGPAFSPAGDEIAYVGHERGDDAGGRFDDELLVVPAAGGAARSLSASAGRPTSDFTIGDTRGPGGSAAPLWAADGGELLVPLGDEGTCGVAAFPARGGGHRIVCGGERDVYGFSRAPGGALVIAYGAPETPGELAIVDTAGIETRLTECNPWLAERTVVRPRRVRPRAADGTILDLWLLDPIGADGAAPETPAPWVLQVHGGPHTAYGYTFMLEFQILASHGIGVAYGNPRGSQSYGSAYANAITGRWGELDAADVLSLLDGAIENAAIDPKRIGLAGGSYGGFMTTWLLGHSDRFAAGVSMRAVNDFVSEVGATDLGWFIEQELGAPWTDGGRRLFESSPMRSAHRIEAPLLVEHSERDFRCAIDQGEQLFTLLRRLGRTAEFVRFAGDGHGLSRNGKPRNRMLRLRAIAHWFVRHLRPAGRTAFPDVAGSLFAPLATEASATYEPLGSRDESNVGAGQPS